MMKMHAARISNGFTLIEAMITVAIIGIIAIVAWPIYDQQSQKNRRSDGIAALLAASHAMEKAFGDSGDYTQGLNAAGALVARNNLTTYRLSIPDNPPQACRARGYQRVSLQSCRGLYQLAITAAAATTYTLTATAIGLQAADDDCDTLTINNLGQKNATGTTTLTIPRRIARCWSE